MSSIGTIYDNVVTRVAALLTQHKRLPDAYELAANNARLLEKGWAIAIAPATNTQRFITPKKSIQIVFQLKITRRIYATEHDATARAATDKLLLADFETLLDDAHANDLNAGSGVSIVALGFAGVEEVGAEEESIYRAIVVDMVVEYFRD